MNTTLWLRLEGAAGLAAACWLYSRTGSSWYLFALLFFAPDLGILGYFVSGRFGGWCYNLLHNYVGPLALLVASVVMGWPMGVALGLIWCAHVSFDRMMGFGLKSTDSFFVTHLGTIGRGH